MNFLCNNYTIIDFVFGWYAAVIVDRWFCPCARSDPVSISH